MTTIVFCDASNEKIDEVYAERVLQEFRDQTGWKVSSGTPIWTQLRNFSAKYCRTKRNPTEVVTIFRLAIASTLSAEDKVKFAAVFPALSSLSPSAKKSKTEQAEKKETETEHEHVTEVERDDDGKAVEIVWHSIKKKHDSLPSHPVLFCNNDEAEDNLGLKTHIWLGTLKRNGKEILGFETQTQTPGPVRNVSHWAEMPDLPYAALDRLVRLPGSQKMFVVTEGEYEWRRDQRHQRQQREFPLNVQ